MGEDRVRDELNDACDEHDRLTLALGCVRARQEELVTRSLDALGPRLGAVAGDLSFGFEGTRAHGVVLARGGGASPLFLIASEDSWALIERHSHGVHAIVARVSAGALLDAFGRDAIRVLDAALDAAGEAVARAKATEAARANVAVVVERTRVPPARAPRARSAEACARTRACPHCDARPNEENYERHLRAVHGLAPDAPDACGRKRSSSAAHEVCRMCGARLPAGRLDPHLTAAHGIFHVHPRGEAREVERAAAIRASRHARDRGAIATQGPSVARLGGSLVHASSSGRDFLREARVERELVARADSPLRNRERSGRFSDAPDVERMDGDSDA